MASSVFTKEGNMSKNTSYASCRLTHLVRQSHNSVFFFFSLGASFSITACKSWFRFGGFRNPLEPSPGNAPDWCREGKPAVQEGKLKNNPPTKKFHDAMKLKKLKTFPSSLRKSPFETVSIKDASKSRHLKIISKSDG